jgi:MFS family permease
MKKGELRKKNIRNILIGIFFLSFSVTLVPFFLPFFLKEKGLSALEIGGLFTLSIALGSLLFGLIFSKIIRKIRLRSGLIISGVFSFLGTFILYLFPNIGGTIGNQAIGEMYNHTSRISINTTFQHNIKKGSERKLTSVWLIVDGFGLIAGIISSIILISKFGFNTSFLIFSFIPLIAIFFLSKIDERTRFRIDKKIPLPKLSKKLKLVLFAEIIYWFALACTWSLVITFLVTEKLSGSLLEIGILFIALYVSMNLTTLLTKKKLDKLDEIKTSILGMSFLLISAIVIILSKNFYVVITAFILEGIGAGIWTPSKQALQWKFTEKENREKVSGWFSGLQGFASALGPVVGGFLITTIGINAPFYLKAGISIISLSIYFYLMRKK